MGYPIHLLIHLDAWTNCDDDDMCEGSGSNPGRQLFDKFDKFL